MELLGFLINITLIQALILAAGIIFVIVEMFHPGFGIPGITGGLLLLIGIVMVAQTFAQGVVLILIILVILGVALTLALHSATKGRLSKILILSHTEQKESGYIGTEDLEFFKDKEGISITVLRPSGTVNFDGVKLDVVTEGDFIPVGTKVRVVKVEGRRIVVRTI